MSIPQDPFILLSWVNTKLRDQYPSLSALCSGEDIDAEALTATLSAAGFEYDSARNQFR